LAVIFQYFGVIKLRQQWMWYNLSYISKVKSIISSFICKAKDLIQSHEIKNIPIFGVVANSQTKGRGTHGREWISTPRNLYLTVVLKQKSLPTLLPITLVPLRYDAFI